MSKFGDEFINMNIDINQRRTKVFTAILNFLDSGCIKSLDSFITVPAIKEVLLVEELEFLDKIIQDFYEAVKKAPVSYRH